MIKDKKVLTLVICILMIPFCSFLFACKGCNDEDPTTGKASPKIELLYTDIHLLENDYIDIKIMIEPVEFSEEEILINLPNSSCVKTATIEKVNGIRYLRINSAEFIEDENEILNGAYLYLKNYDNAESRKAFNVTVHKDAVKLEVPTNISYDENLGTLEWSRVDNARYYEITINDTSITTSLNSIVLNESFYGQKLSIRVRSIYDLENKFPTFIDSNFSDAVSLMVLNKPQNLSHKDGVIYWDKVEGAISYTLIVATPSVLGNRQNEKKFVVDATTDDVQAYKDYNFASSTTYTIKVRANGNSNLDYKIYGTQDSDSITVKKLTAPNSIAFVQGVLSWENIEQNNGYYVEATKLNTNTNEYEPFSTHNIKNANFFEFDTFEGNIPSGQYKFSVKTLGNSIQTLSGDDTQSIVTAKLEQVKNVRIEAGGIFWDEVEMASSYTIYLNSTPINLITNDEEFNSYFLGSSCVAGDYEIQIVACGDGVTYYNSNNSDTLSAKKLDKTNLTLFEDKLLWDRVEGATRYTLYLNNEKVDIENVCEFKISESLLSGSYTAKIMAVGDNKISSEYSRQIEFSKLETPKNIKVENGILKWDSVNDATRYILKYSYADLPENVGESTTLTMTTTKNTYDFKGQKAGMYEISIFASGGVNSVSSNISEKIYAKKLATPTPPRVENGELTYDEINNGTLMVKIKETKQEMLASGFVPTNEGVIDICLYVKGNSGENGENLISSGESEYLKTNVITTIATPVIKNGYLNYSFPQGVTGIKIDYYRSGEVEKCHQIVKYKDDLSTEKDFNGSIEMKCYNNEDLGAGLYNLKIIPQFSSGTVESVEAGNKVYLYGGKEIKLSFCQLDKPKDVGSYSINQKAVTAINNNVEIEVFNEIIKSSITNKYAGYLYWTEIKPATAYMLKVNNDDNLVKVIYPKDLISTGDGLCLYRLDGDFTTDIQGYNFSVRALGNESSYLSGDYSSSTGTRKIKLDGVGEIKIKDGNLTWNNISDSFYEISYNGNLAYTYNNSFALPENSASGNYQIKVRALPKTGYYYAGEYSTKDNVVKINSPKKFYISGGRVQWSNVINASRYVVDINGFKKEFDANRVSLDLRQLIDSEDYFVDKVGLFNVSFKVIGTEDSDKSQSEYMYLSSNPISLSTTIMKAPENIYVENGVLTWTPVTGATKYNLRFYHSTDGVNQQNVYIDCNTNIGDLGNKYSLGSNYKSGLYYFSVMALGDGSNYLNSGFSSEKVAEKLSVIDAINIENGNLTFDLKAGASSYNAKINEYSSEVINVENFKGNIFTLGNNYLHGKYQIKLQAVGNTTSPEKSNELCYLSSDYSSVVNGYHEVTGAVVDYVYKLEQSENMYVANDAINWTRVNNAQSYNFRLDQTVIPLGDTGSMVLNSGNIDGKYYQFSSGSYNVNIQACGGNYFLNSNYRSVDIEAVKLDEVLGLGVEDGVLSWNTVKYIPDNLALYIDGQHVTNLRESFFNGYDEAVGGVRGEKTYYILGEGYEAGDYSIHFVNLGGGDTGCLSSDACEAVTVSKLEAPTNISIDSNTNSIIWQMQELENTDIKYKIYLYNYQTDKLVQSFETLNELSMVISSLEVGKYYIKIGTVVKQSDKLLINSNISDSLMVTMPAVPIGVRIENGSIIWEAIEGVSGYNIEFLFYEGTGAGLVGNRNSFRITVNGENQTRVSIKDFTDDPTFVGLSNNNIHSSTTALGKYMARVNAFVSNSLQSDYSVYAGDNSALGVEGYYFFDMFSDGKGTKASPYRITNFDQLRNVAYLPDLHYVQATRIVTGNMPFTPIGTKELPFTGQFDGGNEEINNLLISVNDPEIDLYSGMFGYIGQGGIVKNVFISRISTTQGYYVGGICGYNEGLIYNSHINNGNIESKTKTTISNQKPIHIGGICGYNAYGAVVDKSSFKGNVSTLETCSTYISYSGGICGYNVGILSQNETGYNNQTDSIIGTYAGGICGYNINTIEYNTSINSQPVGSIYKCTNRLKVVCYSLQNNNTQIAGYAGGIAGINIPKSEDKSGKYVNNNYSICFSNSFAEVVCDSNGTRQVPVAGGLVGSAGNGMYSCYQIGAVYGMINGIIVTDITSGLAQVNVGRIVGLKLGNNYEIDYCYYNYLDDATLSAVGKESKYSNSNNLKVGANCSGGDLEYFTGSNIIFNLNEGLTETVWKTGDNGYPKFDTVERIFE